VRFVEGAAAGEDFEKLCWDGSPVLKDARNASGRCELPRRGFSVLQSLSDKANAIFEIRLRLSNSDSQPPRTHDTSQINSSISANLYGPRSSANSVGLFLQKCGLYLQIPDRCELDVPYMNPHCLTTMDEKTVMTSVFDNRITDSPRYEESDDGGLFDELGDEEQFEEESQPALVKTALHRYGPGVDDASQYSLLFTSHQKQALSFLLNRERGWNFCGLRCDVWRSYDDSFGWTR
jgi:hypothetical protein